MKSTIHELLRQIVNLLVCGQYEEIIAKSTESRLIASDIKTGLSEYPGELTIPPDEAFKDTDIFPILGSESYQVDFFLWYNNEKSDVLLKLLINKKGKGWSYKIWDLYAT